MMLDLGKKQADAFKLKITNGSVNNRYIPIGQILFDDYQARCTISDNPADIGSIIKDSYSKFAHDDMADGIASVVSSDINLILGSYEGNHSEREIYSITTGSQGGIPRVDILLFACKFTAKKLTKITKDCIAVAVAISSVDPNPVTDSSIRALVQDQFGDLPEGRQDAILRLFLKQSRMPPSFIHWCK